VTDRPATAQHAQWSVRDHATARAVLTSPSLTRSVHVQGSRNPLVGHVLNLEGADHKRVRKALGAALDSQLPVVATLVSPLARRLFRGLSGEVDVAARLVRPLTLAVMDELIGLSGGDADSRLWWHQVVTELERARGPVGMAPIRDRLMTVLARRRADPHSDVLSLLAADRSLGDDEIVATAFFALDAGYVNTTNFLGLAIKALAEYPGEYTWLRTNPRAVPQAVDELLRYCEPSARASSRFAAEDTEVAGRHITKGTAVYVYRHDANRDPAKFPNGARLDLRTPGAAAGSLAFGAGPHYCLGAELVHLVADVTLLAALPLIENFRTTARSPNRWDFADELWLDVVPATSTEGRLR